MHIETTIHNININIYTKIINVKKKPFIYLIDVLP